MYLCHKCAGLLAYSDDENLTDIHGCHCMSGWYRGFEPNLTRAEALQAQLTQARWWVELYKTQSLRTPAEIAAAQERADRIKSIIESEVTDAQT